MKKVFYLFIFVACISCNITKTASYNPNDKYSPQQLKEDFTVLDKVFKKNHPSLYWYTSKDSIDNIFSATYNSLNDSLTEQQFKKKLAWAINIIRCGHTGVRSSKNYSNYYRKQKIKTFPLFLKVWNDSAVVIQNLSKEDTLINRGTTILRINGVPVKNIIDSICQLISTDGYSNVFKYQLISFNFPAFYTSTFGGDSIYKVQYKDSAGVRRESMLKTVESKATFLNINPQISPGTNLTRKKLRQLNLLSERNIQIDSSLKTAVISVNTFSTGKLIRFFRSSFKKIRKEKISNVVLDLRLNTGGNVIASTRLSQYLINKPFHVADTVEAVSRSFPYKKYFKSWFAYWLALHLSGKRADDGRVHFRYFEKHIFNPKTKNHFDGHIYILTGGFTFSAATLVASYLKGQQNVTIVGEETGGGAYGNSSILLPTVVLPNTRLRITVPLFRMVLNAKRPKNGRGIFPDIKVNPSSEAIKRNADAKMEKVLSIVKEQKKAL